ncbi:hypothetical protein [Rhodococcus sp. DMU1]|uniref:hypothetical protein n=1 Tax=Rhodococcus sp. DMU1 TaxID=2722825 RepID=UPI00143ECF4B|nr:hypothetical protein [Rhodococcus sp. DMU1]QIX53646.1 hypothetical protein HFP48_28800 [Rhodococcus sp. DMU1]
MNVGPTRVDSGRSTGTTFVVKIARGLEAGGSHRAATAGAGIDGINIMSMLVPGTYTDFVDHVIPVLQARGLAQRDCSPGTLREKLFPDTGPRLGDNHPVTSYRKLM